VQSIGIMRGILLRLSIGYEYRYMYIPEVAEVFVFVRSKQRQDLR